MKKWAWVATVAIVSVVYLATIAPGQVPTSGDESLEMRYFVREALSTLPLSAPNRPIIRRFLESDPARGL